MFDTHCHLNFKAFKKIVPQVIEDAHKAGITHIVVPGTDVKRSKKALEIADMYENIYAAVGIHPHHVYELVSLTDGSLSAHIEEIEKCISDPKVVAVGEIGMDKHIYEQTRYGSYAVDQDFIKLQQRLFLEQLHLAIKYKKSVILHNREAKEEVLAILQENWHNELEYRSVFHCCEPDEELLLFAQKYHMFIGVDGDISYSPEKKAFINKVPLEMLVLETDAPFLLPEPLRSERKFPNVPANLSIIADIVAEVKEVSREEVIQKTFINGLTLFQLQS